ncbi:opacity protein-like surface antigen [Stella humosa]|uniref:Opacity protein-like surface antigen n=1 Tax=Stella humosa TaxID=94 RepID=A0A3N1MBF5_9PROT|nr:outer membrane beta-barrel protein [Stella humosa]ROQ00090.1 opacity protein-like surface antigen [Stella humosa]BBK30675.1 outer surface protein [Stella humosa]
MHFPRPAGPLRNARQLTIRFAYCASLAAIAVLGLTPLPFLATKVATAEPPGWYGRVDAGFETGTSARFRDWNCGGTDPAAIPLYGCLARASGDFGRSAAFGGGIGYRIDERFRIDLTVGWRPGFGFDGQANFPVAGGQAVDGEVSTLSGMVTGYLDLAPLVALDLGPFQPFVGLGAGVSRNRLDRTTLSFPGISQTVTTPGGTSTGFAWTATAGTGIRLTDALTLEIAYRYTDFGRVDSDRGDATRVRTSGTVSLPIDGTRSDLASHGISIGLRHAF